MCRGGDGDSRARCVRAGCVCGGWGVTRVPGV